MSHFPKFCITTDEDLRIKTFCTLRLLKLNTALEAHKLPLHCLNWFHYFYQLPLETEKYAHVTFFFNGGREAAFDLEDRQLVPSPKVATYDLQPEMSVGGVAEAVSDTPSSQN